MHSFDWNDLQAFLAIVRSRSIRGAAKVMGTSHSTASRRLEALETALGVRLFDRLPEGYVPTATGERVLAHVERVESELFGLARDVIGGDAQLAGAIQLTMPPPLTKVLMPQLARFARDYPRIELEIVSTYALTDLSRRDADIAIRFSREPDEWLVGRRLPDFADAVYATREYIAAHTFEGPDATARWLGWPGDGDRPDWARRMPYPDCPAKWQLNDLDAHIEAVRQGLGMSVLPCWSCDPDPELVRVPPGDIAQARSGWVLTHPDLKTTARVRLMVGFLVDALREHETLIAGLHPGAEVG